MDKTRAQIHAEQQRIKAQYADLYDDLLALLYRQDPVGISFEVNPDEYAPEVGTILPRLKTCASANDVQGVVYEEFRRWFGESAGSPDAYARVASELWERWRTHVAAPDLPLYFPVELANAAFRSRNGEAAWPAPVAVSVTRWLGANRYAVLGTELWAIRRDGTICSLPMGRGGRREVHGNTVNRAKGEDWDAFTSRAAAETASYLQSFDAAEISEPGDLRFNITWASEQQFKTLCSRVINPLSGSVRFSFAALGERTAQACDKRCSQQLKLMKHEERLYWPTTRTRPNDSELTGSYRGELVGTPKFANFPVSAIIHLQLDGTGTASDFPHFNSLSSLAARLRGEGPFCDMSSNVSGSIRWTVAKPYNLEGDGWWLELDFVTHPSVPRQHMLILNVKPPHRFYLIIGDADDHVGVMFGRTAG